MKKTVWRSLCALALLPTLLTSCMAFDETDPLHEDSGPPPPMVDLAKLYLNERGGKVAPMHGAEPTVKNTESGKKRAVQPGGLPTEAEVDWETFQQIEKNGETLILFPLKHEAATAMVEYFDEGRPRKVAAPLRSKFLVKRCVGGELAGFVVSYLPSPTYSRRHPEGVDSLGVVFEGTGYSGFYFVSRLDGRMLHGTRYEDGEARAFVNVDNYLRLDTAAADYAADPFSMSMFVGGKMTRTGLSLNVGETPNSTCIFCGLPVYGTMCPCGKTVIIEAERCERCGKSHPWRDYCEMCTECKRMPCECPDDPGYDPTKDPDYNPNPGGSGSQTGGGGGQAGGRGDGGKPSGGGQTGGGSQTTPKGYLIPANITSAAEHVCDSLTKKYGKYMAVCNYSVRDMFKELVGNVPPEMDDVANEMTKYWMKHPEQWQPISLSQAQDYANKGYFVVIGWINPTGGHGHVTVVVPGEMEYSGTFGKKVPVVLEMGKGRRSEKLKMSWGFTPDMELNVFYYKKSIQ